MSITVLADLHVALKEFDRAVERVNQARAGHVAATAQLGVVAAEIVKVVRMMDAVARLEFKDDAALLAAWKSVSRRQAVPQSESTTASLGRRRAPRRRRMSGPQGRSAARDNMSG